MVTRPHDIYVMAYRPHCDIYVRVSRPHYDILVRVYSPHWHTLCHGILLAAGDNELHLGFPAPYGMPFDVA